MPTLEQAREEARLLTTRGLTVYVYRMGDGGDWVDQQPTADGQARIHREGRPSDRDKCFLMHLSFLR